MHCEPRDAGEYTCTAVNPVGETTTTAAVMPAESELPPNGVVLTLLL